MVHSTKPIWRGQFCRQLGFMSSDQCCIRCAKKCNNFSRKCVNKVKLLTAVAKLASQGSTGVYREIPVMNAGTLQWDQGFPVMKTGFLPVGIDLQGVPCKPYRVWVCSASWGT